MRLTHEYTLDIEHRFKYAYVAVLVLLLVVMARLYYLQVIRGEFYHFFSTENSIKAMRIPAVRGMIFDRRGQVMVDNRPAFNITIIPQYVVEPKKTLESLHKLLLIPLEELEAIWAKRHTQPRYRPLVVKADVSLGDVGLIRSRKNPWPQPDDTFELRGVEVDVTYQRTYPEANIATHVLGYTREIDQKRLKQYQETYPGRYRLGDVVGVRGIEERWDLVLRGTDGYEERIVNARGREVDYAGISDELERRAAVPGQSVKLTLDRDMQELARDLFGDRKGAAVVVDVRTGGIVTMYSSPSYDLNRLAGPEGGRYFNQLAVHPSKALLNRAIQGGYPPGSTYKIVTAIGALSEGVVTPEEKITCRGALVFGGRPFHCWRKGGHGAISLHRSIVSSCDVYYYLMGLRLGVDRLAKYANLFNFGRLTGVPLSGERAGLIPTSAWKEKRFGVPWQEGETLSISVGQGYDVVTPIQNAYFAAQVANGGRKLKLHFVESAFDVQGQETSRMQDPVETDRVPVDPKIIAMVREAMVGVVAEPGGTGHRQSVRPVTMGGKTGTAQVVSLDTACHGDECRDHAWFIGFSPADEPKVAAAVVVEHGGFGSAAAAPIVGALFEKYYLIEKGEVAPEGEEADTGKR